jgi:hypothetical protein
LIVIWLAVCALGGYLLSVFMPLSFWKAGYASGAEPAKGGT